MWTDALHCAKVLPVTAGIINVQRRDVPPKERTVPTAVSIRQPSAAPREKTDLTPLSIQNARTPDAGPESYPAENTVLPTPAANQAVQISVKTEAITAALIKIQIKKQQRPRRNRGVLRVPA